ncbi:MAG: hypothetical protein ACREKH_11145, partial [Candidatus Rokuibacteriota bacterium]
LAEQAAAHERDVGALIDEMATMREEASVLRGLIARCAAEMERMKGGWGWRLFTLGGRLHRP